MYVACTFAPSASQLNRCSVCQHAPTLDKSQYCCALQALLHLWHEHGNPLGIIRKPTDYAVLGSEGRCQKRSVPHFMGLAQAGGQIEVANIGAANKPAATGDIEQAVTSKSDEYTLESDDEDAAVGAALGVMDVAPTYVEGEAENDRTVG